MESLDRIIEKHPFTKGLKPEYLKLLSGIATVMVFGPGDFLLRQGHEADLFYLIEKGKVSIEAFSSTGGPLMLQTLGSGQVLGWSWLVPPYQWRFDARAVEDTTAIAFESQVLRLEMQKDHDLAYEFMSRFLSVLVLRVEAARMQLLETYAAHS